MKIFRSFLRVFCALCGVLSLGIGGFLFFSPDMCANEVISESLSPDGRQKIILFQRDCGATTGFSTQASLLSATETLPNKSGNLLITDTDHGAAPSGPGGGAIVVVKWDGAKSVTFMHHPEVRVLKAEPVLNGVQFQRITDP